MASCSSSSSSSSSPPLLSSSALDHQKKYDVFLSFRGEDTRDGFTSHLYAALWQKKIETYIDYRLERGDEISPALLKAIEESKVSVVIFSKDYASSSWCLDELVHILQCKKENGQFVLPVFYGVDPSHVRKQKESYAVAFAKLEERFNGTNKLQEWRHALEAAANLSGWDSLVTRPESKLVEEIIQDILKKLSSIPSNIDDSKGLVGVDKRVEQIMSLLNIGSLDVHFVGIWGMGGIGKTTLASAIFYRLSSQFEGNCFLANVREEYEKYGLIHLQNKLLSTLFEGEMPSTIVGSRFTMDRLCRKKVLIVLDDVNDPEQLELLAGNPNWFGPGSRIIVTSRDVQVLRNAADIQLHHVHELNFNEALHLFNLYAFKSDFSPTDYNELSERIVDYARGLPLALKVLGSHLHSKSKKEWEGTLEKLKMVPNKKVYDVLRVSYEGLDRKEKDIFLDIGCFFKGEDRDLVEKILDGCNLSADVGILELVNKSLITIVDGKVRMHDLLQEMCWEIVFQESKEVRKRSRLWIAEDIYNMLKTNRGTGKVEGIFLDMSKIRDIDLNPAVFGKMHNLRLLKIYNSHFMKQCKLHFPQGLQYLPDELRHHHWYGYPLNSLPSDFNPENLVVLEMPNNQIEKLWNEDQRLEKLIKLDLSYSEQLTQLPNPCQFPNLESLNLESYSSLLKVPSYFQNFDKLTTLNLGGNSNLKNLTAIPQGIKCLSLQDSGIEELPPIIKSLDKLVSLFLMNCKGLKNLPSNLHKLQFLRQLNLHGCSSLDNLPALPTNITYLSLNGTAIEQVPSQIGDLTNLQTLDLGNCRRLKTVPKISMPVTQCLSDYNPPSFGEFTFMNSIELDQNARSHIMAYAQLRILLIGALLARPGPHHEEPNVIVCCPGNEILKWFNYQSEGSSLSIKLPPKWYDTNFLGLVLCVVVAFKTHEDHNGVLFHVESEFKAGQGETETYKFGYTLFGWFGEEEGPVHSDHVLLWYNYNLNRNVVKGKAGHPSLRNATEASFEFYPLGFLMNPVHHCYVKKCGVCLMYAQDSSAGLDQDVGEPKVGESSTSQRPREVSEPRGSRVVILDEEEVEEEPMPERIRNNNSNLLF